MKKTSLPLLAIGMMAASCSSEPKITLTMEGQANDTVVVAHTTVADYTDVREDSDSRIHWDTLVVQGSAATLVPADTTSVYVFLPMQEHDRFLRMIVSPADRMDIHIAFNDGHMTYTAKGTPAADATNELMEMNRETMDQISQEQAKGQDMSRDAHDSLLDVRAQNTLQWALAHADNPALALYMRHLQPDTLLKYYDAMVPNAEQSEVKPLLENVRLRALRYVTLQHAKENVKEGAQAPDFTLRDDGDHAVSLSSMRGQWVVLDFWGTWCGWCIKGIPDMKKAQARLAGKCTFVSIACNDRHEQWLEALKKYEMPWTQLYLPKDQPLDQDPVMLYAVQGFPTKIIISPQGVIAKITTGESPEFYESLDRLVQE